MKIKSKKYIFFSDGSIHQLIVQRSKLAKRGQNNECWEQGQSDISKLFSSCLSLGLYYAWSYFSQVQDLIVSLVELHKIPDYPILQLVQVPLNDSTPIWCSNLPFQFCIIWKLPEGSHCPTIHIVNEQVTTLAFIATSRIPHYCLVCSWTYCYWSLLFETSCSCMSNPPHCPFI